MSVNKSILAVKSFFKILPAGKMKEIGLIAFDSNLLVSIIFAAYGAKKAKEIC